MIKKRRKKQFARFNNEARYTPASYPTNAEVEENPQLAKIFSSLMMYKLGIPVFYMVQKAHSTLLYSARIDDFVTPWTFNADSVKRMVKQRLELLAEMDE